jgi:DNA adenine methylase
MPVTDTPLRYPGGKTQITPFVIDLVRTNNLDRGVYAEPFAGGAGVAWRLLLNGDMSEVWLNDIDLAVYTFWDIAINNPDALCEKILKAEVSIKNWEIQRGVLANINSKPIDLAFATLFLNRTNRSGILKGGVIGGRNQDGNYKIDCRFNREELIKKIQRIHLYKDVVRLSRMDAEACIKQWAKELPQRALLNIDPPYYSQGRDLYLSFYKSEDHAHLASIVKQLEVPWMLTYDDAPQIEQLYSGLPIYRKSLTYYAQVKRRASELLVLAPHLNPPSALIQNEAA